MARLAIAAQAMQHKTGATTSTLTLVIVCLFEDL
jgi:hypothetical protein